MDSIKITSNIPSPKVTDVTNRNVPSDAIFDMDHPEIKITPTSEDFQKDSFRETLFQNLQKEILKPLMNSTTAEADALRKLVLISELFQSSSGTIPKEVLDGIFINSQDLLSELLLRDKTDSIFKGTFFDSLRSLAKLDGHPQVKEAIVSILRHFDAYVNRDQTLKGIFLETSRLLMTLPSKERALLEQELVKLESALTSGKTPSESGIDKLINLKSTANGKGQGNQELQNLINLKAAQNGKLENQLGLRLAKIETLLNGKNIDYQEIQSLLKNETIPTLRQILQSQAYSDKTYQSVATIIDHIVRYDKGNPEQLEAAVLRFSQALKPLSNLTDTEIIDMKNQLFLHAKEAEILSDRLDASSKSAIDGEKVDIAQLLEKALSDSNSSKIINSAQALLDTMVRNESPIFTLMHFLVPLRFLDANSYGEFFVDKDPTDKKGNKGSSENATDIFFTIQSDRYGNFEVELLARDQNISLNIKCPPPLVDTLKSTRDQLRTIVEEQGYSLSGYGVGAYSESQTILQRFPKLAFRKVGIDVTV